MADYPYVMALSRLKPFFIKIQDVGTPPKVTQKWLESIAFKSTSDRRVKTVLKALNFTDQTDAPLRRWGDYRDKSRSRVVMAQALRETYADLFHTYVDAPQRGDAELRNFFSSRTGIGGDTAAKMASTFKLLCELADFNGTPIAGPTQQDPTVPTNAPTDSPNGAAHDATNGANRGAGEDGFRTFTRNFAPGVALNINIQLTVPDTTDETVYDNFFAALKKHLLS